METFSLSFLQVYYLLVRGAEERGDILTVYLFDYSFCIRKPDKQWGFLFGAEGMVCPSLAAVPFGSALCPSRFHDGGPAGEGTRCPMMAF